MVSQLQLTLVSVNKLTLGPSAAPVAAPGTMPRDAFQRAKLSSSASSLAYSSADLAAPGLYPVKTRLARRTYRAYVRTTWRRGRQEIALVGRFLQIARLVQHLKEHRNRGPHGGHR